MTYDDYRARVDGILQRMVTDTVAATTEARTAGLDLDVLLEIYLASMREHLRVTEDAR